MFNEEEKDVASSTINKRFTVSESEVQKILSTPSTKLPTNTTFNDLQLTKEERIAHASTILNSRK
ncbi:hypothetical protein [Sutcliffiella horikoshii]|uniref:hypothetical protein n=1 Tax=Sutcliffiella horikoshii TaxID=79883 RepID=UPI0038510EB8